MCERVHISVLLHCVFSSESTSTHWSKDERWLDVFILCVWVCVCVCYKAGILHNFLLFFPSSLFLYFLRLLGSPLHLSLGRTSSRLNSRVDTYTHTQKHSASAHGHNSHLVTSPNLGPFFRPSRWALTSVVHRNNNEHFSEEMFCLFVCFLNICVFLLTCKCTDTNCYMLSPPKMFVVKKTWTVVASVFFFLLYK